MSDVHYVKNDNGNVHSVDGEHFDLYCHAEGRGGRRFLKPGWSEITEAEARAEHPQLFGARDRKIIRTAKELKEIKERRELEREIAGWDEEDAAIDAALDAELAEAEAEEAPVDELLPAPTRRSRA